MPVECEKLSGLTRGTLWC